MSNRAKNVSPNSYILLDRTVKTNSSGRHSLPELSRRTGTKEAGALSVLFAFDLEKNEPVCSQCFSGNMSEAAVYARFVEDTNIRQGLIVADTDFPDSDIAECLKEYPKLHYLKQLGRQACCSKASMYEFSNILAGHDHVMYRKERSCTENRWYYSFRDAEQAFLDEQEWFRRKRENSEEDSYEKSRKYFGVLVLESDLDLAPEMVYKAYKNRWQTRLVFDYYKYALQENSIHPYDDCRVICGNDFCDFLASIMTFRLINKFDACNILQEHTYASAMEILGRAKKIRNREDREWMDAKLPPSHSSLLKQLGLDQLGLGQLPASDRKRPGRGRPPKSPAPGREGTRD